MLPSTIKKGASEDTDAPGSSSYKKKKESKDKANSSRSLHLAASGPRLRLLPPSPHRLLAAGVLWFLVMGSASHSYPR